MITPEQCRAARALLGWSQQALAAASSVGVVTIRQFELGASTPRSATVQVLRLALEAAGVLFVDANGDGPGVRLKSMYRITVDGRDDPETKPFGDIDRAKSFAMDVVRDKPAAEVAIEIYYATLTDTMGRIRYDREIGDWVGAGPMTSPRMAPAPA